MKKDSLSSHSLSGPESCKFLCPLFLMLKRRLFDTAKQDTTASAMELRGLGCCSPSEGW